MPENPDPIANPIAKSIDRLLALPPAEFVSARNKLASELKKTDSAQAAAIKALPKPSPSVWALNQVARSDPDRIAAFLDASDALSGAQTGRGGSDEGRRGYQTALATQREALDRLVTAAREALSSAGLPANRAVLERVTNNLRWAVLSDETRRLLRQGRLTRDLEPPDFSALMDRLPMAGGPPRPQRATLKAVPADTGDTAKERAEHKRLEALRARQAAAKEQVAAARDEVRRAKATMDEAEREATIQRRALAAAEKKAADANRAHASAEQALARRIAEVDELATELNRRAE
jgi:hypothetical protein